MAAVVVGMVLVRMVKEVCVLQRFLLLTRFYRVVKYSFDVT